MIGRHEKKMQRAHGAFQNLVVHFQARLPMADKCIALHEAANGFAEAVNEDAFEHSAAFSLMRK